MRKNDDDFLRLSLRRGQGNKNDYVGLLKLYFYLTRYMGKEKLSAGVKLPVRHA